MKYTEEDERRFLEMAKKYKGPAENFKKFKPKSVLYLEPANNVFLENELREINNELTVYNHYKELPKF
jgi:hypothetical protein